MIALEQVRAARKPGDATLVHGATGKGNDQIRFEFAYRSLAPDLPVLAPWKVWDLGGREQMIQYLTSRGFDDNYEVTKAYSFDENLFHLSVEGGPLEDASTEFDIENVLGAVADRFAVGPVGCGEVAPLDITVERGVPVALDGVPLSLGEILKVLNQNHRFAPWAWDLVIENRFTGIKSRGLYINPAAKLLHVAVDALARSCLNKPTYDQYVQLGRDYGTILYRGEYFSDQRQVVEAAASGVLRRLTGSVTVHPFPVPYVSRVQSESALFRKALATFECSDFAHADAEGFIKLGWLTSVGRSYSEDGHGGIVETGSSPGPYVCADQHQSARGLVPASA